MKLVRRPAGAHPARPRVRPPEPVASRAPVWETRPAMRRHAHVRAVGRRPRNLSSARRPSVLDSIAGNNRPGERWARRGGYPAGCSTRARTKRTVQYTWEALASPRRHPGVAESRCPVSDARHVGGRTCCRPTAAQNKRPPRGRPKARGHRSHGPRGQGVGGRQKSEDVGERAGGADPAEHRRPVSRGTAGGTPCPRRRQWRTGHRDGEGSGKSAARTRRTVPRAGASARGAGPHTRLPPSAGRRRGGGGGGHQGTGRAARGGASPGSARAAEDAAVSPSAAPTCPHPHGPGEDPANRPLGVRGHAGPRRRAARCWRPSTRRTSSRARLGSGPGVAPMTPGAPCSGAWRGARCGGSSRRTWCPASTAWIAPGSRRGAKCGWPMGRGCGALANACTWGDSTARRWWSQRWGPVQGAVRSPVLGHVSVARRARPVV